MFNDIIHDDCLRVLPHLAAESVNFVLTDPPYLVNYRDRSGRSVPNDNDDHWLKPAFAEIYRVLAEGSFCIAFYGWPNADRFLTAYRSAGFRVVGHFVFPKRYASRTRFVHYQHECARLLVKGVPWLRDNTIGDVIEWTYTGNKLHPTQKPLPLLIRLIGMKRGLGYRSAGPREKTAKPRPTPRTDMYRFTPSWRSGSRHGREQRLSGSRRTLFFRR